MSSLTRVSKSPIGFHSLAVLIAILSGPTAQAAAGIAQETKTLNDESAYLGIHDARGDVKGKYQEGLEFLKAGDCKKAQESLGFVVKQANGDANVAFLQGMAFRCEESHDRAAELFRKAIRTNRDLHVAYKYLAFTYLDMEKPKKANEILFRLNRLRRRCGEQCPDTLLTANAELATEMKRRKTKSD